MKQASPLVQMTLAVVAMTGALILLADLFFGVLPDPREHAMAMRKGVSESLAVQVATLLQHDDRDRLAQTLAEVSRRDPAIRSMAVRQADGALLAQAGDHARGWRDMASRRGDSQPDQVVVPLTSDGQRWGQVEIAFAADDAPAWWRWLTQPLMLTLGFVSTAGALVVGLYMRRALQHLDPSAVIPERVQLAFDAMAEGVVILDARGRILLANKAFRGLHGLAGTVRPGRALSGLEWLAAALPGSADRHPWTQAMASRGATTGHQLRLQLDDGRERHLVINCAPITDAGGAVRGCLTTFNDMTELHVANARLVQAMDELSASKQEIERKNDELQRLATRDPLTGCLNRRALLESFERLLGSARAEGTPLACMLLDIDHFKSVNDTHGHGVGDRVIQEVAAALHAVAGPADLVCRYGGEEFCVVLPGLDVDAAAGFAERARARIEAEVGPAVVEVEGMRVTASLGVDALSLGARGVHELIDRADHALYQAKRGGRNRVRVAEAVVEAEAVIDADVAA